MKGMSLKYVRLLPMKRTRRPSSCGPVVFELLHAMSAHSEASAILRVLFKNDLRRDR
jgi:hypothetical protein